MTDKVFSPGEVLTAADVNDYLISPGRGNAIINGAFDIWQRGTSFTSTQDGGVFFADRFIVQRDGTGGTATISQQTFTPGEAPLSGYEGTFYARYNQTASGSSSTFANLRQNIEDVRTFAGQTVTVSFFARADTSRTIRGVSLIQQFGAGGSANITDTGADIPITTAWARYTQTFTLGSMSGKTIGPGNNLSLAIRLPLNTTQTIDIWGVQLEAGTVATPFKRNANSLQGELAACQRYYQRYTSNAISNSTVGWGVATSTTSTSFQLPLTTTMRATPNSIDFATSMRLFDGATSSLTITGFTIGTAIGPSFAEFSATVSSGLTQFRNYRVIAQDGAFGFIGLSAEL